MAGMTAAVKCWVWAGACAFVALLCAVFAAGGEAPAAALIGVLTAIAAVALAADGLRHYNNEKRARS